LTKELNEFTKGEVMLWPNMYRTIYFTLHAVSLLTSKQFIEATRLTDHILQDTFTRV